MGEVVALKRTRLPRSRDAFYQAIPVNEIQGRMFHFGRNKMEDADLAARERQKALEQIGCLPEDRSFQIIFDPNYGVPGPLAYRIWTGIEKTLSDAGSGYGGRLQLTARQIAKIARRSFSGQAAKEIGVALNQLKNARIHYWHADSTVMNKDGTPVIRQEEFSLIESMTNTRANHKTAPHFYIITVPEIILGFLFQDRYFFCMSWDRVKDLQPQSQSVARILYRYMSYRFSNAKTENFRYTKDYATMCNEWFGGLNPYTKKSEILRKHLDPRFKPIVGTDLLQSYDLKLNKNRTGYNVIFKPGKEFFTDYRAFYTKQLPLNFGDHITEQDPHLGSPETNQQDGAFALLGFFHDTWFKEEAERDYLDAEVNYAQAILDDYTLDQAKSFVTWGIEQAHKTRFDMRTFNALKQYRSSWQNKTSKDQKRNKIIVKEQESQANETAKREYESYCLKEVRKAIDGLNKQESDLLETQAMKDLTLQYPNKDNFESMHILAVKRRLMQERLILPDFENWKYSISVDETI